MASLPLNHGVSYEPHEEKNNLFFSLFFPSPAQKQDAHKLTVKADRGASNSRYERNRGWLGGCLEAREDLLEKIQ
jgi:hypothetical protein